MSLITAFAPGRIELLGNHTDYNQGVVLSCAIPFGITASGRSREDHQVVLRSSETEGAVAALPGETLKPRGDWADYPLGVLHFFREAGAAIDGFEMEFTSDLPVGAGLSSSAAIEVATGVFLSRLSGFSLSPLELAKLCRRAENEFVGVQCGLLDQVSSIFGRKDHVVYLDCRAETVERVPFPEGYALLVTHSGVKHALTGGEYNERREQCFEAARLLGVAALRDATSAQLAGAGLPDLPFRRAAHVVGENERVFAAIDHLRAGRVEEFGALMTASHQSSIRNFENSTPELDALVEIATAIPGVHGSRLTGGGFGGATISLVPAGEADRIGKTLAEVYHRRTGNTATVYQCALGDGALATAEPENF